MLPLFKVLQLDQVLMMLIRDVPDIRLNQDIRIQDSTGYPVQLDIWYPVQNDIRYYPVLSSIR